MYVYNADLYCDDCGEGIARTLFEHGTDDTGDSDAYPQSTIESESDSPNHCACGAECHNAVDLTAYGLTEEDLREGAPRFIGALLDEDLTEDGRAYLDEMLTESDPTPYQRALHRFWRESYSVSVQISLGSSADYAVEAGELCRNVWPEGLETITIGRHHRSPGAEQEVTMRGTRRALQTFHRDNWGGGFETEAEAFARITPIETEEEAQR